MATVTFAAQVWNTTAGDKTSGSFTPAVGDLIVVVASSSGLTGGTTSVTDSQSGAYTQVDSDRTGFSTTGVLTIWVRNALITSATSTTVTVSQAGSSGGGCHVYTVAGMSRVGSNAVRSSGGQSSGGAGGTPAPVLSSTPLSANACIAAVSNGSNPAGLTPPTNFTENASGDQGYNTPATGLESCSRNSGQTNATITFGSTSATAFASVAIELDISVPISAGVGSLVITGQAPSRSTPVTVSAGLGALTLTGQVPTVSIAANTSVSPGASVLTLTGQAPTVSTPVTVSAGLGALIFTGRAPTVATPVTVSAGVGSLIITGQVPTIATPVSISAGVGSLTFTGQAPSISAPVSVAPSVGSLVLAGQVPAVGTSTATTVSANVGTLFFTGAVPTVTVAPTVVTPGLGSLLIAGLSPTVSTGGEVARVTWAQIEAPVSVELARVTWAQIEVPVSAELARVTWAQIEVPEAVAAAAIRPYPPPAGRHIRGRFKRKFVVTVDGQTFFVNSEQEAESILAAVRESAELASKAAVDEIVSKRLKKASKSDRLNVLPIKLETPQAAIRRGDRFGAYANDFIFTLQDELDRIYRQARMEAEILLLLKKQWEVDEDEALVALLLTN